MGGLFIVSQSFQLRMAPALMLELQNRSSKDNYPASRWRMSWRRSGGTGWGPGRTEGSSGGWGRWPAWGWSLRRWATRRRSSRARPALASRCLPGVRTLGRSPSRTRRKELGRSETMRLCQRQVALLVLDVSLLHSLVIQKPFCLNKMRHFSSWISTAL